MKYETWPFRPVQQRSIEETEMWWQHCYVANMAEQLLLNTPHWWILVGGPGSGKTVALTSLARREAETSFMIPYPPRRWPGSEQAWLRDQSSHLAQMMAAASIEMRHFLSQHLEQLISLTVLQREFVRWLLELTGGERTYWRWLHSLPSNVAEIYSEVPQINLFPSTDDPLDIDGQIDELVCLVQAFGLQRVLFTADLNSRKALNYQEGAANLFGWLNLMHHPGFVVVATMPTDMLERSDVLRRARGRVHVQHLNWLEKDCREIANGHIKTAVNDPAFSLQVFANEDVLQAMGAVIEQEYGKPTPAGWIGLAETILFLFQQRQMPLALGDLDLVKRHFFQRHLLLRLDMDAHGVWRGPNFMRLDDQPLWFLELLYRRRGHPINWDDDELRTLAGSKNNVHSIASRTRKVIEPISKKPVYLVNKRGEGGYWLEGFEEI